MIPTFSVCVTGIGGLGVMWLSRVIADAACGEFEYVTRTESRGLSQRGGAVCSIVRFGGSPISPTTPDFSGDLILALDQIEALRSLSFLKPEGNAITNSEYILPTHVLREWSESGEYGSKQQDLKQKLSSDVDQEKRFVCINLKLIAGSIGCNALNSVLLGSASSFLPIRWNRLLESASKNSAADRRSETQNAFFAGMKALFENASAFSVSA